ncbi:LOW QUALITY PROTEIN: breast carcinoma-amplified sequence 4 [Ctenodactylus gundi]
MPKMMHATGQIWKEEQQPGCIAHKADQSVRSGAREIAPVLTQPGAEAREVEAAIEGMLLLLEEFCSLTDMVRDDTWQILEENIPLLQAKVTEMRIYAKVDWLEAFVKMVGGHAAFLEAHVLAEQDHGSFPRALHTWLGSAWFPHLPHCLLALPPAWLELSPTLCTYGSYPVLQVSLNPTPNWLKLGMRGLVPSSPPDCGMC